MKSQWTFSTVKSNPWCVMHFECILYVPYWSFGNSGSLSYTDVPNVDISRCIKITKSRKTTFVNVASDLSQKCLKVMESCQAHGDWFKFFRILIFFLKAQMLSLVTNVLSVLCLEMTGLFYSIEQVALQTLDPEHPVCVGWFHVTTCSSGSCPRAFPQTAAVQQTRLYILPMSSQSNSHFFSFFKDQGLGKWTLCHQGRFKVTLAWLAGRLGTCTCGVGVQGPLGQSGASEGSSVTHRCFCTSKQMSTQQEDKWFGVTVNTSGHMGYLQVCWRLPGDPRPFLRARVREHVRTVDWNSPEPSGLWPVATATFVHSCSVTLSLRDLEKMQSEC